VNREILQAESSFRKMIQHPHGRQTEGKTGSRETRLEITATTQVKKASPKAVAVGMGRR
jgi:hypothetical protein